MSSLEVSQIVLLVPSQDLPRLCSLPLQPTGKHDRRPSLPDDRKKVRNAALQCLGNGSINQKTCDYLANWAQGTRRRLPRPLQYEFLKHRINPARPPPCSAPEVAPRGDPRPVLIFAAGGAAALPMEEEQDDDAEPGPISIA